MERKAMTCNLLFIVFLVLTLALLTTSSAYSAEPVCSRADILVCQDWEDSSLGQPPWGVSNSEYATYGGGIVATPVLLGSNRTLELLVKSGTRDSIFPGQRISPQQGPTYLRWYAKWSNGYIWNSNITKHMYLTSWDSGGAMIWRAPLHMERKDGQPSVAQPVFQLYCWMTDYPDSQCVNGGEKHFFQNIGTPISIVPGRWYEFEIMVKPDTVGVGFSGELKLWINGELKASHTNVSLRQSTQTSPINGIFISSYYGGGGDVSPQDQRVWYDNIVASTHYIGTWDMANTVPPQAPSGLSVK